MQVDVNGDACELPAGATVADLLRELGFDDSRGLAVAVDDAVHPRSGWERQVLAEGARITLIRAAAGG